MSRPMISVEEGESGHVNAFCVCRDGAQFAQLYETVKRVAFEPGTEEFKWAFVPCWSVRVEDLPEFAHLALAAGWETVGRIWKK